MITLHGQMKHSYGLHCHVVARILQSLKTKTLGWKAWVHGCVQFQGQTPKVLGLGPESRAAISLRLEFCETERKQFCVYTKNPQV